MSEFENYRNQLIEKGIYLSVPCSQGDYWGDFVETYVHDRTGADYEEALDYFLANRLSAVLYALNQRYAPKDAKERESYYREISDAVIEDNRALKRDAAPIRLLDEDRSELGVYQFTPPEKVFEVMGFSVAPGKAVSVWESIAAQIQINPKKQKKVTDEIGFTLEEIEWEDDQQGEQERSVSYEDLISFHFTDSLTKKEEMAVMKIIYQPLVDSYADFRFIIAGPSSLYLAPYGTQAGHFLPILAGQNHDNRWEFSYFSACN